MSAFLLALAQNPQLPAFVLGVFVPFVYRFLTEGGVALNPKVKVWLSLSLSAVVALVPIVASWLTEGMPTPEMFFGSITAAFVASELTYRQFLKEAPAPTA